jgi:hypothetical protein
MNNAVLDLQVLLQQIILMENVILLLLLLMFVSIVVMEYVLEINMKMNVLALLIVFQWIGQKKHLM